VRNHSKWEWALICLIQTPLGGILYLCIGRIGPAPQRHAVMIDAVTGD
jgi:hypothetical protein